MYPEKLPAHHRTDKQSGGNTLITDKYPQPSLPFLTRKDMEPGRVKKRRKSDVSKPEASESFALCFG